MHACRSTLEDPTGRQRERAELLGAFERVREGSCALVLLAGYSGVGKTALVTEVRKALAQRGGFFASGKFDQLNRNTPYSSVAQALRELLQQLLGQGPEALTLWRAQLAQALGASAAILVSLLPELALLLGPQPTAPLLGPAESLNRFDDALEALVRTFCASGQPLVLLLDDLQWADPASLRLLRVLFGQAAPRGLLLIGAYRDNEVDEAHPLRVTIEALQREGASLTQITLPPLREADLLLLLADTLALSPEEVEPLARLIYEKTRGNPFFTGQFLSALYRDGLLRFSIERERWEWSLAEISRRDVTDNVIAFMTGRLQRLSESTQHALRLAACIGHTFDLLTLAVICERPVPEVARSLWVAVQQGLILPLEAEHRYTALLDEDAEAREDAVAEAVASGSGSGRGTYRFLHDRVQQAAYSLIAQDERAAVRLRIGRLLLGRTSEAEREERLFDIVNHLDQGRALITDPAERRELAALNRRAGERARAGTAFSTAADYFGSGLELLGEAPPADEADHELLLALLLGAAESESLCGRFASAEQRFERALALARNEIERAHATCVRLKLYQVAGRYRDGVILAEPRLRALGLTLPRTPEEAQAALAAEVGDIHKNLAGRPIEDLVDAPEVSDPRIRAAIDLLVNAAPCAYIGLPDAFPFIALKTVNLSLCYGNIPASCMAYSVYGLMLVSVFNDVETGYRFSEMSLRLNEKFGDISLRGTLLHLHGDHINFWKNPIRSDLPILEKAFVACQQAGDHVYGNYLAFETIWQLFEIGEPLADILVASERFGAFARKTNNDAVYQTIRIEQQFFRSLMGATERPFELAEAHFDIKESVRIIEQANFGCGIAFERIIRMMLCYRRGELAGARAAAAEVTPVLGAVMAMPIEATFCFFRALTLVGSLVDEPGATAADRAAWQATVEQDLGRLGRWAASSPQTFQAKHLLVRAEAARARGELLAALADYDGAIDAAEESGALPYAALAYELGGRCLRTSGRERAGALYLLCAARLSRRWGAAAQVERLESELVPLRPLLAAAGPLVEDPVVPSVPGRASETVSSHEITNRMLDVSTVLRAAQAIASEIQMPRLLEQVLRIVLAHSGAQRAVLLLSGRWEDDAGAAAGAAFTIVGIASCDPESIQASLSLPLSDSPSEVPASVVALAARTRETVLASDMQGDPRFAADPYLLARRPRSFLCMPLLHQSQLSGVLYLENAAVRDAFSEERAGLLRLLCAQVAIALENAHLYERVRTASAQLHGANARLEAEVAARTADLHEANARLVVRTEELALSNQRLQEELAERQRIEQERQRIEQERIRLQDEVIRSQRTRLAEMATPLIPLSPEIMVMPLIGTMDSERARQVMDTALSGVEGSRARVVILDITGLRHIDTSVARTLVQTAGALRLLGARALLTGLRAEVAQTLVALGVDLGGVASLSNLQSGIAHANQLIHGRRGRGG